MTRAKKICQAIIRSLSTVEHVGLIFVALATVYAAVADVWGMVSVGTFTLADLLLLFIYLEVLVMIRVYFEIGRLPVRFPLYIAIVALARFLIIDMKQLDNWQMLEISLAVLILTVAVLILRYGQIRLPYTDGKSNEDEL